MPEIIFVSADGEKTTVIAKTGDSVMQTAIANDVDGILAECGGSMMCATCHCYVDDMFVEKTGPKKDGEGEMLECVASELRASSRLSCQIILSEEMNGLIIHLPEEQV